MKFKTKLVLGTLGILISLVDSQFSAIKYLDFDQGPGNLSLSARDDVAPGIELRILALGSSITYGTGSTDGNGYREKLLQHLSGTKVQYIGSIREGTMADNYVEGHSGYTIAETRDQAKKSLPDRPNLILLHEGTNDLDRDPPIPGASEVGAPQRLGDLIDFIVDACPDATLLVAQLIDSADSGTSKRIHTFNAAVPGVVDTRAKQGKHVITVDMSSIGIGYLVGDGIHPTDEGYQKMADFWYQAIKKIPGGWLKAPIGADPHPFIPDNAPGHPNCLAGRDVGMLDPRASTGGHHCLGLPIWHELGRISHGVGSNGPAVFHPKWYDRGHVIPGFGHDGLNVRFADLRGHGKADYIWIDPKTQHMYGWLNDGVDPKFHWTSAGQIANGQCHIDHLRFADLTGSGKAAFVCIDGKDGSTTAWFSNWDLSGPKWDGPHKISGPVPGGNINSIFYMDINGDSRDDMVVRTAKGGLNGWLNIGKKYSTGIQWVDVGVVGSAAVTPSGQTTANTTFADLNNDGRDDILVWDNNGGLTGYMNIRNLQEGHPIWGHQNSISDGHGIEPHDLRVADVTGNGWADYIMVNNKDGACRVFANNGAVDVSRVGDGTWVADMNGDGLDDKILINENGDVQLWINGQANPKAAYGWNWYETGTIAKNMGASREYVRLADIDGDGRADYIIIDQNSGAIRAHINGGDRSKWKWTDVGQIHPGVGDSIGIQFADITGDGKADLIHLDINSHMTVYRNENSNGAKGYAWTQLNAQPIDFNAGFRRDMRFADIDGDGKADAIWIHPQDGSAVVWLSKDPRNRAGWQRQSPFPANQIPGNGVSTANTQFGRLNVPYGRYDIVQTDPSNGAWSVWRNDCNKLASGSSDNPSTGNSPPGPGLGSASSGAAVCGDPEPTTFPPGFLPSGSSGSESTQAGGGSQGGSGGTSTKGGGAPGPSAMNEVIVFGGSAYTEDSSSQFVIGGQTLTAGGEITVSGTPISLLPGGTVAVIAGSTESLSPTNSPAAINPENSGVTEILTVGGSTYTDSGSGFVIDGQTLTPGGQITISGTPVSLDSGASFAVVAGSTETLATTNKGAGGPALTIVIGGSTFTANSASQFIIDGQTLTPNGQITVAGTPISLEPDASSAVVGGSVTAPVFPGATGFTLPPDFAWPSSFFTTGSSSASGSSGGGGDGFGITIPDFTTVATASRISGYDRNGGGSAINALKPAARSASDLFGSGLKGLRGLLSGLGGGSGGGGSLTATDLEQPLSLLIQATEELGSISQALGDIELDDFSDAVKPQIQSFQINIPKLERSLTGTLNFIWTHKISVTAAVGILGGGTYLNALTSLINFDASIVPLSTSASLTQQSSASQSQCSKSVVTDYWVSCLSVSGSSSCTTTSSALSTGCDVSASATTTIASCPVISYDTNDDEGEDGDTTPSATATQTSSPNASPATQPSSVAASATSTSAQPQSSSSSSEGVPNPLLPSFLTLQTPKLSTTPPPPPTPSSTEPPPPAPSSTSAPPPPPSPSSTAPPPSSSSTGLGVPPPPATSSSPVTLYNFFVGQFEECSGTFCLSKLAAFVIAQGASWNVCTSKPAYEASDYVAEGIYPLSVGPFDGGGQTVCRYIQDNDKVVGSVVCDELTIKCTADTTKKTPCGPSNNVDVPDWLPIAFCTGP